jgi:hypothetical protein
MEALYVSPEIRATALWQRDESGEALLASTNSDAQLMRQPQHKLALLALIDLTAVHCISPPPTAFPPPVARRLRSARLQHGALLLP